LYGIYDLLSQSAFTHLEPSFTLFRAWGAMGVMDVVGNGCKKVGVLFRIPHNIIIFALQKKYLNPIV
jgi:hypothetical protein